MTQQKQETKAGILIIVGLFGVGVLMVGALVVGTLIRGDETGPSSTSTPTVVEYYVSGSAGARSASLTYEAAPGATEQDDVRLPWRYSVRDYKPGMFLYVSARNSSDEGCVDVRIFINKKSVKDATSCGRYSSASVKGSFR